MKKIAVFIICMLLIALVVPSSIAKTKLPTTPIDDVDINIYAGFHGKDIGLGILIDVLNHKTENVTVFFNITVDYPILNKFDFSYELNFTVSPEAPFYTYFSSIVGGLNGLKFISITAESGNTVVTRSGLSIRRLVIFTK